MTQSEEGGSHIYRAQHCCSGGHTAQNGSVKLVEHSLRLGLGDNIKSAQIFTTSLIELLNTIYFNAILSFGQEQVHFRQNIVISRILLPLNSSILDKIELYTFYIFFLTYPSAKYPRGKAYRFPHKTGK